MNTPSKFVRQPLRCRPVYQQYIWGGERIILKYGRQEPPGIYAESWEVSVRPEGQSTIAEGSWAGRTLAELVETYPREMLGRHTGRPFPLLVKLIDARERLSVQVHPDEAAAAKYGGEPKTEAWYILDAVPGASLMVGFRPGVNRDAVEEALRTGDLTGVLNAISVRAGDVVFIPGGRVHALESGLLILEVQQNSNTTYRLYDWGRVGFDGRPRETHVAQALRVVRWNDHGPFRMDPVPLPPSPGATGEVLVACPAFHMERWLPSGPWDERDDSERFRVVFVASGRFRVEGPEGGLEVRPGTTLFLPAVVSATRWVPLEARGELIRIFVP
jgi:mannose-6-phosphate isomerase